MNLIIWGKGTMASETFTPEKIHDEYTMENSE